MVVQVIRSLSLAALIFAGGSLCGAADEESFSFTTRDGLVVEDAAFSRRTPDGVSFLIADGVRKIPFELLPEDLQERFGYDAEKAEAYRAKKREAAAEERAILREAELARRAARQREALTPKLDTTVSGFVLQVLEHGVLLHDAQATRPGKGFHTKQVQTDGPTTLSPNRAPTFRTVLVEVERPHAIDLGSGTVFLASKELAASALDGQHVNVLAYAIGRYRYVDKLGAERTVAHFTLDAETAIAHQQRELAKLRGNSAE